MTTTQYITIEDTVFVVTDNGVQDRGTNRYYDPASASESADDWTSKARVAWAARDKGETFEREVEDDFDFEAESEKMYAKSDEYAVSDPTRYYAYRAIANTYINEVADPWALADDICKRAEGLTEHEAFLVVQERVNYFDNFYC